MSTVQLQYPTEAAYLDYSKALCDQMKNIKLNVLREAMAQTDGFQTIRSYRTALKKQEISPNQFPDRVYRQDDYLYFDALLTLNVEFMMAGQESWNDHIESMLIGTAYGMQEPDAEDKGENLFRCTGYINIAEIDDEDNTANAIAFFTEQCSRTAAINMINQKALNYALSYLSRFPAEEIHPDLDIELDDYTLPCDDDLLRSTLPIDAIHYYELSIKNNLMRIKMNDESLHDMVHTQALKDCWEALLSTVIRKLASIFLELANKEAINTNEFKQLSERAMARTASATLRNIILNQF